MKNIRIIAIMGMLLVFITACTAQKPIDRPETSQPISSGSEENNHDGNSEDSSRADSTQPPSGTDKFEIGFSIYDEMSGYPEERELKMLLPPKMLDLRYNGLAEYGHIAKWDNTYYGLDRITYEVNGSFDDGSGIPGSFKVYYILDRKIFTVTEKVIENTRSGEKKVNSIIPDLVILKAPLSPGTSWEQQVTIDGEEYTMNAAITDCQAALNAPSSSVYTVKYTVEGIPGYFNNTYIEIRKFQTGKGMVGFQKLMPGDIGLSGKDLEDEDKVEEAMMNHMFGYGLSAAD